MNHARIFPAALLLALQLMTAPSQAADVKGSRDHPVISRYAGSSIISYEQRDFDEATVFIKALDKPPKNNGLTQDNHIALEGRVTKIGYETPKGRSTLEVIKNYETELKKAGFDILFSCKNEQCGKGMHRHFGDSNSFFIGTQDDARYLAASLKKDKGDIYVKIYLSRAYNIGGPKKDNLYSTVEVIKLKGIETGMVTVDANAMSKKIAETGKVALYGIYFDSGKTVVKAESQPALEQIALLMKNQPALKIIVVGHTDNQGALDLNMTLSQQRAAAVLAELVKRGVKANRLKSWGIAYLSPVASNRSEEGRAKNRRVELVEQ